MSSIKTLILLTGRNSISGDAADANKRAVSRTSKYTIYMLFLCIRASPVKGITIALYEPPMAAGTSAMILG
jgi:hypothetical protein